MKSLQASQTLSYPQSDFTGEFPEFWNATLSARLDMLLVVQPPGRGRVACGFPVGLTDQQRDFLEILS